MNDFKVAREAYRPEKIKVLFLAEASPCSGDRFFYFPDVKTGDNLFLYLIRTVFPDLEDVPVKQLRLQKEELLNRFKTAGYFLEDSVQEPIPKGTSPAKKIKIIENNQQELLQILKSYKNIPLFLLSSTVFKANYKFLKDNGFNIVNDMPIPFPGSGQQNNFKMAMEKYKDVF